MDFSFFNQLLVIFSLSVIAIALFHRLRLPDTLAYLVVGLILGPTATGIIDSSFDISLLAEIGVVFLLFSLGLEFSMAHMFAMRRVVFGLGGLQVIISTAIISLFGFALGFSLEGTFVMAAGLALSSTAIVSKELSRRNELKSSHGQLAIGTLIFQDLAAVVFLIIVSGLSESGEHSLAISLFFTLLKGSAFVVVSLFLGRYLMPKLFHEVAQARSEELFVLAAIVVALVAAWLTHLLSLSMALGGFVAGMVLGESHYRHQIKADIRPFRDILLGLFFVSVGLMVDLQLFIEHWLLILVAALGLICVKCLLISKLSYLIVPNGRTAIQAGIALAQGGEFCFALVAVASQNGVLGQEVSAFILSVTIVSMAVTPLLIRHSGTIADKLLFSHRKTAIKDKDETIHQLSSQTSSLNGHILICGYGRVGQAISRFLEKDAVPFVALDDDAVRANEAAQAKIPVFYGDCRRPEILMASGLKRARMVVICIDRSKDALRSLKAIREVSAIPVMVRTRDDSMMDTLLQHGATQVIPEVLESSLLIVGHVLSMLGQPERQIQKRLQSARREHYHLLHNYFFGLSDELLNSEGDPQRFMHGITLIDDAFAVGLCLTDIPAIREAGVIVESVTRGEQKTPVSWNVALEVGDVIMLSGTPEQVEHGEIILLGGR